MKYYRFMSETPYCGTEQEFYHSFENEPTQNELESMADEYAYEAYESYLYLHTGWADENLEGMSEEEREEFCEDFRADCFCTYEEITQKEFEENT